MKRVCMSVVAVVGALQAATDVAAEPASTGKAAAASRQSVFMRVFGPAQPPYGFVRFCDGKPASCAASGLDEDRFQPSAESLSDLDEVNRTVNRTIQPVTDAEIYGVSEYWTLPVDKGDCEDYALLKQKRLMEKGWPSSALLLTVVRDERGEGHAVLTARTAQGDYILDNKVDEVRLWSKSGYEFVMRQSYIDPRVWVSLDATRASIPSSLAGVRGEQ
jgi:predicted transglutaminase-like cysteine proteinase